jgi:ATP-dependent RNA helicase DHX37/DHR1
MQSKAKKRSESTLHRDESHTRAQISATAAALGLNVPMPKVLAQSRADRKDDRVQVKKDRNQRIKTAMLQLGERAADVDAHRKFVAEELANEKRENKLRKLERQAEHIKARRERDDVAAERDAELRERQAKVVAVTLDTLRKREKAERKALRKSFKELEARAAIEPIAVHIPVKRTPEIAAVRESLPVTAEEQPIMEAVEQSKGSAVIVCGETGSGKTTQVPQFLWEAGYGHPEGAGAYRDGMIAVTEPRRVAAISMAKRVAEELNEEFGGTVCYHVRYQNNLSERCKLKFMTEGILLKEMQSDFMLRRYSAIVIDEAHERSVSCDVLVGLLSRIVPLRQSLFEETRGQVKPLKLIIMSATLRVADFRDNLRLFPHAPPLIKVDVRRFPVSTHYSRRTELHRYVDEAFNKVRQLHKKLPPGGVLVFLSTQREIDTLCKRLQAHYAKTRIVYEDDKYTKHSLLTSRKEGGMAAAAALDGDENEDQQPDEFGLAAADYALDGDEDAASPDDVAAAAEGTFAGETGLADDFDYGDTREAAANSDSEDDDAVHAARAAKRVQEMLQARNGGASTAAPKASGNVWAADDEVSDWGDDDGARPQAAGAKRPRPDEVDGGDDDEESGAGDDDDDGPKAANAEAEEDEEDGAFDTLHILPLYSLLDHRLQQRVFDAPPKGKRLMVIATNIAETSITIPNVRYVIDTGRVKNKTLQPETQAQAFKIEWISQAAAEQRAGRAGRTGPGHCYRLYSTAVYSNLMPKHTEPEISRTPLESVVLMMKHLRIDHVGSFPFPSPPSPELIKTALLHLRRLGALDAEFRCTSIGGSVAALPVTPRYGRIILEAIKRFGRKAPQVVAAVLSIMSVATVTMDPFALGGDVVPPKALQHPGSDFITFLRVFNAFAANSSIDFCRGVGIMHKSLQEAALLRRQIEFLVAEVVTGATTGTASGAELGSSAAGDEMTPVLADFDTNEAIAVREAPTDPAAPAPTSRHRTEGQHDADNGEPAPAADGGSKMEDVEARVMNAAHTMDELVVPPLARDEELALRRLFIVGLIDQVARRATVSECREAKIRFDDSKTSKTPYYDCTRRAVVFIHPSSTVATTHPPPEWVLYSVLQRSQRHEKPQKPPAGSKEQYSTEPKLFMRGVTIVTKPWLDEAGFDEDEKAVEVDHAV